MRLAKRDDSDNTLMRAVLIEHDLCDAMLEVNIVPPPRPLPLSSHIAWWTNTVAGSVRSDYEAHVEHVKAFLADVVERCKAVEQEPALKSSNGKFQGAGRRRLTVSERMLAKLESDPEAKGWGIRQWELELKCAKSTISECKTWRLLERKRMEAKAEKIKDRHRR
jgi:hypothetical protein